MAPRKQAKPTTIYLVRHGRTPTTGKILPGRAKGLHLSDEGRTQAEEVAKHLHDTVDAAAVYCSPLERTRETAAPIARAYGVKPTPLKGLLECDFGDWTGQDLKKLNKLPEWRGVTHDPAHFRFPNGESFLEMQARISDAIATIVATHPEQNVVAVSHADPIKMAICLALNTTIDSMHRIDVQPCSVSTISYAPGGNATVTGINLGDMKR